jgi:hypothetical protein
MQQRLPADQQTAYESVPDQAHVGRFSAGVETRSETREHVHRGRFSDGLECLPQSVTRHNGRFSVGLEDPSETSEKVRRGSFADGERARVTRRHP